MLIFSTVKSRLFGKLKYQMAAYLVVVAIIPILTVQIINFTMSSNYIAKKNTAILQDNLALSRNNANDVIGEYRRLLYQMTTDDKLINNLSACIKTIPGTVDYNNSRDEINSRIYTIILMHPEVRGVGLMDVNGNSTIADQGLKKNEHIAKYYNRFGAQLYENSINNTEPILGIIKPGQQNYDPKDPLFYIAYRIYDLETMRILGSLAMFIEPGKLNHAINNVSNTVSDFSDKMLVTKDGSILCSKDNKFVGYNVNKIPGYENYSFDTMGETFHKDTGTMVIMTEFDNFQLRLTDIINNNKLYGDVHRLWAYSFALIFVVMLITLLVSYLFSKQIVNSIKRMYRAMEQLKKDNLNITISEQSNNEIRLVETAFNSMVGRIQNLIEENNEQSNHIIKMTMENNRAELKSLELQINPHFLFNTIDTINWMAIREGCCDISEQLNKLANILRYTVYNMNGVVPINKETEWMEQYLELQKNRFPNRFDYDITVDKNSSKCYIHKLLLQPFLENSIIHGFEKIQYKGHILVSIKLIGNYITIKIMDNGRGMTREKIKQINRMFYYKSKKCNFGIGLENIFYRLHRYYNGKAKLYASSDGNLTCFTLFIPNDN